MVFKKAKKQTNTTTAKPQPGWKVRIRPALFASLLLLSVSISHCTAIWNDFVLDDRFNVRPFGAVSVKREKWEPIWYELYTDAFMKPLSEPLTRLTMAIDYQSGHMEAPGVYHATNLLFTALGIIVAFFLLHNFALVLAESGFVAYRGFLNFVPLFACALFAAHPLSSEAVCYISGRAPVLCFFLYMSACLAYLKGFHAKTVSASVGYSLAAYLLIVVSLFSSATALSLPLTMLVMTLMGKPRQTNWKTFFYERSYELGSLLLVALALPFILKLDHRLPDVFTLGLPNLDWLGYFTTELKVLAYLVKSFILPFGLTVYPAQLFSSSGFDLAASAGVAIIALALFSLYFLRNKPFSFLGSYLFLIGLLPQLLLPATTCGEGTRFFFSLFGLSLLLSDTVLSRLGHIKMDDIEVAATGYSKKYLALASLPILLLSGFSIWRDRAYANNETLLSPIKKEQDPYTTALLAFHHTLDGGVKLPLGRDEAQLALSKSQELPLAYLAMGNFQQSARDFQAALFDYEKTLELAEKFKLSDRIKGFARGGIARSMTMLDKLKTKEDIAKVKECALDGIKWEPTTARNYLAYGSAIFAEGKPESPELACKQFDYGRRFDLNDPEFAFPVALAALSTGYKERMEQAYGAAKLAYRLHNTEATRLLFARAALESGRINKGFEIMSMYWDNVESPSAEALLILSALEKQNGRPQAAEEYRKLALERDADIERKFKLFLVVPPKPSKDLDNEGPNELVVKKKLK